MRKLWYRKVKLLSCSKDFDHPPTSCLLSAIERCYCAKSTKHNAKCLQQVVWQKLQINTEILILSGNKVIRLKPFLLVMLRIYSIFFSFYLVFKVISSNTMEFDCHCFSIKKYYPTRKTQRRKSKGPRESHEWLTREEIYTNSVVFMGHRLM